MRRPPALSTLLTGFVRPVAGGPARGGLDLLVAERLCALGLPVDFRALLDDEGFRPISFGELSTGSRLLARSAVVTGAGRNLRRGVLNASVLGEQSLRSAEVFVASAEHEEAFLSSCFDRFDALGHCLTFLLVPSWGQAPRVLDRPDVVVLEEEGVEGAAAPPALLDFLQRDQVLIVRRKDGSASLVDDRGRLPVPGYGTPARESSFADFAAGLVAYIVNGGELDRAARLGAKAAHVYAQGARPRSYADLLTLRA